MARTKKHAGNGKRDSHRIEYVTVSGFKSIATPQTVHFRGLTVLVGANSSGKSSIMQPLLLMKQTIEAPYDPGVFRLDGPNVKFTSASEFWSRGSNATAYSCDITVGFSERYITASYELNEKKLQIAEMTYGKKERHLTLRSYMKPAEKSNSIETYTPRTAEMIDNLQKQGVEIRYTLVRSRCFLEFEVSTADNFGIFEVISDDDKPVRLIERIIHLPGLRGFPNRTYPLVATGNSYAGTFDNYTASILTKWRTEEDERLIRVGQVLEQLGLTWKVEPYALNDTQIEIRVGRLPKPARGGAKDLVNLADVGYGVSQVLPVITAVLAAEPGQLVYLEQPEIHLHPRAQIELARFIAKAVVERGIQVVVETHSSLFLLEVQTLVARNAIAQDKVDLHWFARNKNGMTTITRAKLRNDGSFGDWPQDFGAVELEAQSAYLDAAEAAHE